jgi:predicted aspartyl protease
VTVFHDGTAVDVPDVLVDTGSASTLLNADVVASLGINLRLLTLDYC